MVRKVGYIFVILDGVVKGDVLGADIETLTIYLITDLDANAVGTSLESLQEPIIGELNFSLELRADLTYLFALGFPVYRIRFYVPLSLTTIEKTFRVFRQSIYNESLLKLKELKSCPEN